jgi:predicted acylesterase/phospholipase RssA
MTHRHVDAPQTRFFQTCLGVFQGGGCRGAAFVGAFTEATRRGVGFAGVAGTSAGSIVAALIGAGATSVQLEAMVSRLDFRTLLMPAEPATTALPLATRALLSLLRLTRFAPLASIWANKGIHSSKALEAWLNAELAALLPGRDTPIRFEDLPTPTWIVATDLVGRDAKVWSSWDTPKEEVAFAARCSCSIPGFFQPVNDRYLDGGALSNLPVFVFEQTDAHTSQPFATRLLAFSLEADEGTRSNTDTTSTLKALADTIVDGASKLQLRMTHNVHVVRIPTGHIRATDFDKLTPQSVASLTDHGRTATAAFLNDELGRVQSARANPDTLVGKDEIYGAVTERLQDTQTRHVVVCEVDTGWVYALYPTLLEWRMRGVALTVVLTTHGDSPKHGEYRRRLLRALGAAVVVVDAPLPFHGFLFDPEEHGRAEAVVAVDQILDNAEPKAVRYTHTDDYAAIQALFLALTPLLPGDAAESSLALPFLAQGSLDTLTEKLQRHVAPYSKGCAHVGLETVETHSLVSLSKIVKGYKFQQIHSLAERFRRADLPLFQPALAQYPGKGETIVTPPVAEFTGGRYILVQGNTRAVYCLKRGITNVRCIVLRNVGVPLPGKQRIELRHVLIGGRTLTTKDRYGQDIDRDYRQIEWATHHPDETLI